MKRFFSRNRKLVEIILTLGLVFLVAGYYFLIYIPERENEIIARRFRTLQRIERNMQDKFQGYQATIRNCLSRADEHFFRTLVKGYNNDTDKFNITILDSNYISIDSVYKKIIPALSDSVAQSFTVSTIRSGRKLLLKYEWYKLKATKSVLKGKKDIKETKRETDLGNKKNNQAISDTASKSKTIDSTRSGKTNKQYVLQNFKKEKYNDIKHITIAATIDYREFVMPLLKKGVFDQYVVFNVHGDSSNVIYEDFPSGISFKGLDSLFGTNDKIYTSRIIKIETGGEKYMAFLHPCGYNNKNDRIVAGLLKQETFDVEKRRLPERMVTIILFITLFSLLLLPVIRLALMGKKERIRFSDLFAGYFSFLLLVPVIILVFFWNNKHFLSEDESKKDSKQVLAEQISKSLKNEIAAAYKLLDKMDALYTNDSLLIPLVYDTINVHYLDDSARAHTHFFEKNIDTIPLDSSVSHLASVLKNDANRYRNTAYVFWMDSSGKEMINWAFEDDPPRGNYKEREYYKNVRDNNLLSLDSDLTKNYAIEPIVSRIDGKFKVVLAMPSRDTNKIIYKTGETNYINAKASRKKIKPNNKLSRPYWKKGWIIASPSTFSSVINPVLPLGFEFSITDAEGNTIFDSDTTENLNENLREEFMDSAVFKVALATRTSREFKTSHEDRNYSVLVQPISGLPYFILILEEQTFSGSLTTQSISFTMVMMFSFFVFLCIEMILILIAHHQETRLQRNRFDFSWIHPEKNSSHKYFSLFLFNSWMLIVLSLFCFINFSNQRLTEYIFLFIMAALITSIAAFAFRAKDGSSKSISEKRLKREKTAMVLLSAVALLVLVGSFYYGVLKNILLFSFISAVAYFFLFWVGSKIDRNTDYLVNFRLMIFSRLLLTTGLPVIVFFSCIYNFEQRLEERLKLLDYAKNIEEHTKSGERLDSVLAKVNNGNAIRNFYTDLAWVKLHDSLLQHISIHEPYSKTDSLSISLLKTSRLHYNDISANTEGFEFIKPFDTNALAFNNIFGDGPDTLQYGITQVANDKANINYISLSSGLSNYAFPSIFVLPEGVIFWLLLFGSLALCYQLLRYATDKVFGKNIPVTDEFKILHEKLLVDEQVKYLFVQGVPGSGKSRFIKDFLETGDNFIFYDKEKQPSGFNAKFFNLGEIPGEAEMANDKEAYDKQTDPYTHKRNNWYYKLSALEDRRIDCIVFTHFEYKIFDEFSNNVKLDLIEKMMGLGKKKIIISSDIDPVEYFYSLKKFMPVSAGNGNRKTENKTVASEPVSNTFLEYFDRWNNLLGRFTNIYRNIDTPVALKGSNDLFKEAFLTAECSNPSFLNNYKAQLRSLHIDQNNEEDYILKIQSLCDHSYRHLLSSLTKEEQLTLYDLAEDGLMNTTNYTALTMLLNKGLIKKDDNGVLMIINRSFRNFILTAVNADEIKSIEKEINDDHTWNDYKYPVLIILGALLYFVLSSNPEKFGNILPVISGVMAGIPTVIKMLSFLKPGEVKG